MHGKLNKKRGMSFLGGGKTPITEDHIDCVGIGVGSDVSRNNADSPEHISLGRKRKLMQFGKDRVTLSKVCRIGMTELKK